MNRRDFTVLLPALFTAAALPAGAQTGPVSIQGRMPTHPDNTVLPSLASGVFPPGKEYGQQPGRSSRRFLQGMLPDSIRTECHITTIEPGTPHEPVNKHLHSELWYVIEGSVSLNINGEEHPLNPGDVGLCCAGDLHYITNTGKTRASYFVITMGPLEGPNAQYKPIPATPR